MRSTFPSLAVGVNVVGKRLIDFCSDPKQCMYLLNT